MASSQPSDTPRFSAAIEGWWIHCCRRRTASSCLLLISARIGWRSCADQALGAQASATALATVPLRKVRRSKGVMQGVCARRLGAQEEREASCGRASCPLLEQLRYPAFKGHGNFNNFSFRLRKVRG